MSTIHKKCFSSLNSYLISIFNDYLKEHRTASLISQILIRNQLALINPYTTMGDYSHPK